MILKLHGLHGISLAVANEEMVTSSRFGLVDQLLSTAVFWLKNCETMMLVDFWCCIKK